MFHRFHEGSRVNKNERSKCLVEFLVIALSTSNYKLQVSFHCAGEGDQLFNMIFAAFFNGSSGGELKRY